MASGLISKVGNTSRERKSDNSREISFEDRKPMLSDNNPTQELLEHSPDQILTNSAKK